MDNALSVVEETIQEVKLELISFAAVGTTATITIHCGFDDVTWESNVKRKSKPKRIVRDK